VLCAKEKLNERRRDCLGVAREEDSTSHTVSLSQRLYSFNSDRSEVSFLKSVGYRVTPTSAKQQISGGVSVLVWAFPLASQDQTRHENAKSMNCAMLGIRLLMPLFKYNSNIDIG